MADTFYNELKTKPFIIAGPCVLEGEDAAMKTAEKALKICEDNGFDYIFKASFDKANRTSITSYRGPGLEEGLRIFEKVKKTFGVPATTDIHEAFQAEPVGEVVDIVQIPAFLCRQTDLLVAAAKTGKIVNIKKAQFLSGADMKKPAEKVLDSGNSNIMLTERGSMFGYGNLVVDFRNLADMKSLGFPVIMDATHSVQRPGGLGDTSGGDGKFAPYMAYSAAVWGADGYFFEIHENPAEAKSDGPNMIKISDFSNVLHNLKLIQDAEKQFK